MNTIFPKLCLLALAGVCLCTPLLAADALEIEHPWIREAPPTSKVLAAYATIVNPGDRSVTISGISSPDFASVELHRTVIEEGIARMLHIKEIEVPANSFIRLEPGGLHLMLFNPEKVLVEGDKARLTLHLENDACVRFTAPVIRSIGSGNLHSHH